ncbi:hypothetical protein H311_00700, partial [Anncaliia algerae PRA109]
MNRQRKYDWQEVIELSLKDSANEYEGKKWTIKDKYEALNYTRIEYVCSGSLDVECNARLKALNTRNPKKTILYRALDHHPLCRSETENKISINQEIFQIYDSGRTKPSYIEKELRKKNIDISTEKISRTIYNRKLKNKLPTSYDLLEACDNISLTAETLVKYDVLNGKTKIIISNKSLLTKLKDATNFHLDGTYKLIDLGYPVLVFGVSDNYGTFHLMAIGICDNESAESYIWCVKSLLDFYKTFNIEFKPKNI